MKKIIIFLSGLALIAAGCSGGGSSCAAIVDDGMDLFQDAIDQLDGISLTDLDAESDPFSSDDFDARAADLERRTTDSGCTDEEMTELFADKLSGLEADDSNPIGQVFISGLTGAVEDGEFDFGG